MPPDHLSDSQRELWRQIEKSAPPGVYTSADSQALERMAIAWDRYRHCQREIEETGFYSIGSMGQRVVSPAIRIQAEAEKAMHRAGEVLGLSPVARSRIAQPDGIEDDPFEMLLDHSGYRPPSPAAKKLRVIR